MRQLLIPEEFFKALAEKAKLRPIYSRLWLYWLSEYADDILKEGFVEEQIKSYSRVSEIKEVFDFGMQFLREFKVVAKGKRTVYDDKTISDIRIIIEYLNNEVGSSFSYKSATNMNLIVARMKEGFSVADFKKVIDKKVYAWKGTDQQEYLRPLTLFSLKHFENYLNEAAITKKGNFQRFTDAANEAAALLGIERR